MRSKQRLVGFATALVLVFAFGSMKAQAQEQGGMTLDEFMNAVLTLMTEIQERVERIETMVAQDSQVSALETRVAVLEIDHEQIENAIATGTPVPTRTPTAIHAPPTLTPYQRLKLAQEEELRDDLTRFLFQQDKDLVKSHVSAPQLIMGGFYIVAVAPLIRNMVERCDITFYDMVKLIDEEAKKRVRQNNGEPIYEDGKPILVRQRVVEEWVSTKVNGAPFCPETQ